MGLELKLGLKTLTVVQVAGKINRVQKVIFSWLASLPIFLPCSCFLVTQPNAQCNTSISVSDWIVHRLFTPSAGAALYTSII